jgi:hypothetical protein
MLYDHIKLLIKPDKIELVIDDSDTEERVDKFKPTVLFKSDEVSMYAPRNEREEWITYLILRFERFLCDERDIIANKLDKIQKLKIKDQRGKLK